MVGVRRVERDLILDAGGDNTAFVIVAIDVDAGLHPEGMMAHDELASAFFRGGDGLHANVVGEQHAGDILRTTAEV